jgi:hypothetical protein
MIFDFLELTPLSLVICGRHIHRSGAGKHHVKSMAIMRGRARRKISGNPFLGSDKSAPDAG